MGLGRILGVMVGAAVSFFSGYGVYKLIEMILRGATSGQWLMVIAGGILAYLFAGLLILAFFVGLAIIFLSLFD